jgi:hypothetical protein
MLMNLLKTKGKNPQIREMETEYSKLQKLSAMALRKSRESFAGHMDNARQCNDIFFSNSQCIDMAIR